jgi:hypothetical protein
MACTAVAGVVCCACKTVLGDAGGDTSFLVCAICSSCAEVKVCDTSGDGFVCGDEKCKLANRSFSDILELDVLQVPPLCFVVEVSLNAATGVYELVTAKGVQQLRSPDDLAFNFLGQHGYLVRPGHKHVVKMSFANLTTYGTKACDDPLDTIYMEFSKPLENVTCPDGVRTTCHKWHVQCIAGGNLKMCQPVPLRASGRHRVMLEFSEMERII